MTGLCVKQSFCKIFIGKRKLFVNIKEEVGNIIYDLNIKVCEFLILVKWMIFYFNKDFIKLETLFESKQIGQDLWDKRLMKLEDL